MFFNVVCEKSKFHVKSGSENQKIICCEYKKCREKMIEWDEKYSVRVPQIDLEHKKFLEIINTVITSRQNGNRPEEVVSILRVMTNYALEHFKTEEMFMIQSGYKEYQSHKKEHHDFSMKVVGYCKGFANHDHHITDDLLEYVQKWFVDHILETDKKYMSCLQKSLLP
jgi:hemerythrin